MPLVYILAPNKKKMYEAAFEVIAKEVPQFKPDFIITDFEIGAIHAAQKYFPSASMHACFFHLSQSVWRHIQSIGLQSRYINDADFALNIRKLLALAFIPAEDIAKHFSELVQSKFWSDNEDDEDNAKIQILLNYFESTYIGAMARNNKRKAPLFPPTLWSVYLITTLGME